MFINLTTKDNHLRLKFYIKTECSFLICSFNDTWELYNNEHKGHLNGNSRITVERFDCWLVAPIDKQFVNLCALKFAAKYCNWWSGNNSSTLRFAFNGINDKLFEVSGNNSVPLTDIDDTDDLRDVPVNKRMKI